jgi:16S rRNA processing protein RimM
VRGELKCRVVTDFPRRRFRRGAQLFVAGQPYIVEQARLPQDFVLLKLAEVTDRDAAEALRGRDVEVPATAAGQLPRGRFYWHQVIGLRVESTDGQALGTVRDILETGANDVYIVDGPHGEILLPAIKDVIKQIDPAAGRMLVQLLPGLLRGT